MEKEQPNILRNKKNEIKMKKLLEEFKGKFEEYFQKKGGKDRYRK